MAKLHPAKLAAALALGAAALFAIACSGGEKETVNLNPSSNVPPGLSVTLFFGGWGGPGLPGPVWFLIKLGIALFVMIWIRATLPRASRTMRP